MRFLRHSRGSGWHVPFLSVAVVTSPLIIHALRLHGRRLQLVEPAGRKDDHAPLFELPRGSVLCETERAGVQLVNCWPVDLLCLACHGS